MITLNEMAIIMLIIIIPFLYLMSNHPIRCERKLNREERRKSDKNENRNARRYI